MTLTHHVELSKILEKVQLEMSTSSNRGCTCIKMGECRYGQPSDQSIPVSFGILF